MNSVEAISALIIDARYEEILTLVRDSLQRQERRGIGKIVPFPRSEVIIVGDLHDDERVLPLVVDFFPAVVDGETGLLFLGDYGLNSFFQVLSLEKRFPDKIVNLLGNHEKGSLAEEDYLVPLRIQCGEKKAQEIFACMRAFFNKMPLATVSENGIVAVHDESSLGKLGLSHPRVIITGHYHLQRGYELDAGNKILTLHSGFKASVEGGRFPPEEERRIAVAKLDLIKEPSSLTIYCFNHHGDVVEESAIDF